MTLVTGFMIDEFPFLVGDFLLSSGHIDSRQLALPTHPDITFQATIDSFPIPSGLRQKLALVSDTLAIGWADSQLYATSLIKEVRDEFGDDEVHGDDVVAFLKTKEAEYGPANLVGLTKKEDTISVFFFNGALGMRHPVISNGFAIGSGAQIFSDFAKDVPVDSTTHVKSTMSIMSMLGGLMGEELRSQNTLLNNFGGGYEVVYYTGQKFEKIPEISYCFWSANQHKDKKLYVIGLPIIIKQQTVGDICVVRRTTCPRDRCIEGRMQNVETQIIPIKPVLRRTTDDEIESLATPSLNSLFQCHYIFGNMLNGQSILGGGASVGNQNVTFTEEGDDLLIQCPDELVEGFSESLIAKYRELPL